MSRLLFKLLLGGALALTGLLAAAGTSHASRSLSLAPGGAIAMASLGLVSMRSTIAGIPIVGAACNVSLSGSLSRVMPKRSGTSFGAIHSALATGCRSPNSSSLVPTVDMSLIGSGWSLSYSTFGGRLPTPTAIAGRLIGLRALFDFPAFNMRCLVEGDVPLTIGFSGSAPNISGLVAAGSNFVPLRTALGGSCLRGGEVIGSFTLTPRQTLVLIS